MKKLLLLLLTAIVTVSLGSCEGSGCKNCNKKENTYTNTDKTGRANRKCPNGVCPMKKNGKLNTIEKERVERRW
jgi:hypothetical protein